MIRICCGPDQASVTTSPILRHPSYMFEFLSQSTCATERSSCGRFVDCECIDWSELRDCRESSRTIQHLSHTTDHYLLQYVVFPNVAIEWFGISSVIS